MACHRVAYGPLLGAAAQRVQDAALPETAPPSVQYAPLLGVAAQRVQYALPACVAYQGFVGKTGWLTSPSLALSTCAPCSEVSVQLLCLTLHRSAPA